MLREVADLGKYLMEEEDRGGLRDSLTLNKISDRSTLIAVRFSEEDGRYRYDNVVTYDLDGNREKILYNKNWHNTNDKTPTSMVHRVDTLEEKESREGAVRNDAVDWIFEGWYDDADIDDPMITSVLSEYEAHEREIRQAVKDHAEAAESLGDCVLTVQYEDENGDYQFIKHFDIFVEHLRDQVAVKWAEKHGTTSRSEEKRCIACHEEKEVFGFAFPLAIYTVDNRKYAPDFDQGASWKNLPICADCSLQITVGVNFIENNTFEFDLNGDSLEYYVIPKFPITSPERDAIMDALVQGKQADQEYSFMEVEYIYSELSSTDYPMTLDIVFFTEDQSQQQIERYVSDVEPPWMRKADQSLRQAYSDIYGRNELHSIDYEVDDPNELMELDRLIYRVLPNTYGDFTAFLSDALDLVDRILRGNPIEYHRLIDLADKELQSRLRRDQNYRGYAMRMFLFITFLTKLNILDYEDSTEMKSFDDIMRDWGENVPEDVAAFFEEFSGTFDHPAKRAVFLEGVLAQHLMDVQSEVRSGSGDPPLRKKLSNLRLTQKRAKTFLSELFRDIDAYNRKSDYHVEYRDLREAAAMYFAEAERTGWEISDEEVRYFFTLGLSLNRVFKKEESSKETEPEVSV